MNEVIEINEASRLDGLAGFRLCPAEVSTQVPSQAIIQSLAHFLGFPSGARLYLPEDGGSGRWGTSVTN